MQLDNYEQSLTNYLEAISLTTTQDDRISSALENILSLMLTMFPDAEVYAQGSYSTDTLVKPLTSAQGGGTAGEYDIDIVVERPSWEGATDALDEVADILEGDPTYSRMSIDRTKNSCVRIKYAADGGGVGFHVDLVPTKNTTGSRSVPDRGKNEWKHSDAKRFAEWFNDGARQSPGIRQIVLIMKRLRDLNGLTNDIKSILMLTLVVNNYFANGTIMGNLLSVLDGVIKQLTDGTAPFIANPVNTGEDLGANIGKYDKVRNFFLDTKGKLSQAVESDDAEILKQIFGSAFSYTSVHEANSYAAPVTSIQPTRAYGASDAKAFEY
jgi:hypothetical protein